MYCNHHLKRVLTLLYICLFGVVSTFGNHTHDHQTEGSGVLIIHQNSSSLSFEAPRNVILKEKNQFMNSVSLRPLSTNSVTNPGIFGALFGALKKIAVYGGLRLGEWVMGKIFRKARNYEHFYYRGNPGAIRGVNHILQEWTPSSCNPNGLPAGNPGQHIRECDICSAAFNGIR